MAQQIGQVVFNLNAHIAYTCEIIIRNRHPQAAMTLRRVEVRHPHLA